jgi:hypothetical protein
MPTAKKRINITVDDEVYEALGRLAEARNQPIAGVGLSLIEQDDRRDKPGKFTEHPNIGPFPFPGSAPAHAASASA